MLYYIVSTTTVTNLLRLQIIEDRCLEDVVSRMSVSLSASCLTEVTHGEVLRGTEMRNESKDLSRH